MVDLASARDARVAVEAVAVLEVEQSFGDALKRDAVAAEEEVLELQHRPGGVDVRIELGRLFCPPARDKRAQERPECRQSFFNPGKEGDRSLPGAIAANRPATGFVPAPGELVQERRERTLQAGDRPLRECLLDPVEKRGPRETAANRLGKSPSARSVFAPEGLDLGEDRGAPAGLALIEHLAGGLIRERLRTVELDHPLRQDPHWDAGLIDMFLNTIDQGE